MAAIGVFVAAWATFSCAGPVAADVAGAQPGPAKQAAAVLDVGIAHSCAVLANGSVKCWGGSSVGQLGLGNTDTHGVALHQMGDDLPAVDLGSGRTAIAIATGGTHTCALLDNAKVKCWGWNVASELGLGDIRNRGDAPNEMGDNLPAVDLGPGRTVLAITAGALHTCALLDNGTVKCWGNGVAGQLGLGDPNSRGFAARQMGAHLPAVDLGPGRFVTAVTAGSAHTCALLDNGAVKCWGLNSFGQLGLGDIHNRGNEPNEMGTNLPDVDLGPGRTARAVTAGAMHTCALLDNATVKCWGLNSRGELGLGDHEDRGDSANEMGTNLPAVDLGPGRTAVAITAGLEFTCAVLDNATVKCWGDNLVGQLGLGDTNTRGDAADEMGANLPAVDLGDGRRVLAVAAGTSHTCAVLDDATVKCWGFGGFGSGLGYGDAGIRGDQPNEMGSKLPEVDLGGAVIPAADPGVVVPSDADFLAMTPTRLFDTRPGEAQGLVAVVKQKYGGAGKVLRVKLTDVGGVPASQLGAVSLNLTVANPVAAGFVTVYPCGDRPLASSINYVAGQVVANAVIAPVSASGEVCLFSQADTDLLADVNGSFAEGSDFVAVSPSRLFDTRVDEPQGAVAVIKQHYGGGEVLRVKVTDLGDVPSSGVAAVSLNVTAVNPVAGGFVTVYPCGDRPLASNVNYLAGQVVANAVVAPVSVSGEVCLFSQVDTDLVADVNGWFAADKDFAALTPSRLFDTRVGEAQGVVQVIKQRYGGGSVLRVKVTDVGGVPATRVAALSLNVTVVDPVAGGFVTAYPCGDRPLASNLNYLAGQVVANAVIAPVSASGEVCLFSQVDTDLIADVNGWFAN